MKIASHNLHQHRACSSAPHHQNHDHSPIDSCGTSVEAGLIKRADILAMKKPLDPSFFANKELQQQAPEAFALMPEAATFHEALDTSTERKALAEALKDMPGVANFDTLNWSDKEAVMRKVFDVECKVLGMKPPELAIESDTIPGPAFYDFDLENPGPGKVILNPTALKKMDNPFAPLLLLMHETRHSQQFQDAFVAKDEGPINDGYRAAFTAQRSLGGWSFADFTTLLHEYEAFQFANGVLEDITGGKVDTVGMGTLAGQFSDGGHLRTDLKLLFKNLPHDSVLDVFNELEKKHYEERNGTTGLTCCGN